MNDLRLYGRLFGAACRGEMQYRASVLFLAAGHFLTTVLDIIGIFVLFGRFGAIRGWRLEEVALFYGITHVAFALTEMFCRGFDMFSQMIRRGDFDRVLLRPRSAALQVAAGQTQLSRLGHVLHGLLVLLWAAGALGVDWNAARLAVLVFAILGGTCLFAGLFVLQATLSFWTTETLEIMATVTYGGNETGQYPLSVYRPWFRKFFTFVVPLAAVSYFPALRILDRPDTAMGSPAWFGWVAPAIGVVFLVLCLQVWRIGVRHYRSTGS